MTREVWVEKYKKALHEAEDALVRADRIMREAPPEYIGALEKALLEVERDRVRVVSDPDTGELLYERI